MAQYIKQGNIFGRIGSGIGQGLAEQIPKEIERSRLASGLRAFEQDHQNLTPIQQLARLSSVPGITPQMIQSFSELAKQQNMANALTNIEKKKESQGPSTFPISREASVPSQRSTVPSITKESPLSIAQKGFFPPKQNERDLEAAQLYNANPARYKNDPQKALESVDKSIEIEKERQEAAQTLHKNLTHIQDNVVDRLKKHSDQLAVDIPANVYSQIEDKAIQATKPADEGGGGRTEQQAMKEFGKELDDVSRDYKTIDAIGNWAVIGRPSSVTLSNLKSLQRKFAERKDTENLADKLISTQKLSPMMAYAIAEPVSMQPSLGRLIKSIPELERIETIAETVIPDQMEKTLKIAPKLMAQLGNGSPLSVGYELQKKGYDPNIWFQYLVDHRKEWDPTEKQARQLEKPNPFFGTVNDWWLSNFSGLE